MFVNQTDIYKLLIKYAILLPIFSCIALIDSLIGLLSNIFSKKNKTPLEKPLSKLVNSAYRSTFIEDLTKVDDLNTNLYTELSRSVQKYSQFKAVGARHVNSVEEVKQSNGKYLKKISQGEYEWNTYGELFTRINNLSDGLLSLGLKSNDNIVLFAETRQEWLISAFACFRIKVPVVTLYASLGTEALAFGINQTKTSYLITTGEQLPKIMSILDQIPKLTHLIVITDKFTQINYENLRNKKPDHLNLYSFKSVEELGQESSKDSIINHKFQSPIKTDLAIIMYTSGSTGIPKGVMISHENILVISKALMQRIGVTKPEENTFIGYLPLAHVLELVTSEGIKFSPLEVTYACEFTYLINGIKIGYSSTLTLMDSSLAVKSGELGDLKTLNPTLMSAVPLVLERIKKATDETLYNSSWIIRTVFELAYTFKLHLYRQRISTVLLDTLIFKKIRHKAMGTGMQTLLCAGAMLNKEIQEFSQVVLCSIIQAYGCTETTGGGSLQFPDQNDAGNSGSVVNCSEMRLVDWNEGGYRVTDTPNPRGEIYIGGNNITLGYYNMPDKTAEDFKVINGMRYFVTGDIGEMINGNVKIIDRKKDLVKLQGGEYVSLNKVETIIKLLPFVDNCCVVADPTKAKCVSLIVANRKKLTELITSLLINDSKSLKSCIISDSELKIPYDVNAKLVKIIGDFCSSKSIAKFEIPFRIKFVSELWMPDSGFVTDSLKIKRREIEKFYVQTINQLYYN